MKTYAISTLLVVLTLLAISCVHSPLGMQTGDTPNTSAPAAAPIASPQDELNSKEQAALDKELLETIKQADLKAVAGALDGGANIKARDQEQEGETALHKAAWWGHREVARLLLDRGADIEAKNNHGWTALHETAWFGHREVVRLLLARGANIDAQNNDGQTALELAKAQGHQGVLDVLHEAREQRKKRELETLEELQIAPPEINQLIINMGYGDECVNGVVPSSTNHFCPFL